MRPGVTATAPGMNRLVITARLAERGAMRYTPAGLPALDLQFAHESMVSEDGHPRKVAATLRAVGIGAVTQALAALPLGASATLGGFVANTRNGRGLVLHITDVDPLVDTTDNVS